MHKKTLLIFRRDLRLEDNTALTAALKDSETVIPCFIFDSRQTAKHPYKSEKAFQFMIESLIDLNGQLERIGSFLYAFRGLPHEIVEQLIRREAIDAVYFNEDYTPFSQKRDKQLERVCKKLKVKVAKCHDALLYPPGAVKKADGGIYTVYTPFMRKALSIDITVPIHNRFKNYYTKKISQIPQVPLKHYLDANAAGVIKGGRRAGQKILKSLDKFTKYDAERNIPALDATTHLSAHNKFGTSSPREVFYAVCRMFSCEHTLIRELLWRDFFTHIGYHFPHVLGEAFNKKYAKVKWQNDKEKFQAWCRGQTGFPIVDAGMRELNETGFMHNRLRMITASFLVKDLRIDWRWGEKYFAQKLIDYDPFVNNGNWQWAASTGCDAQPYFRIFNPWLQQERYDPECVYIKRWVKELKDYEPKGLHRLAKKPLEIPKYPQPIVDHKLESTKTLGVFKSCQ